MSRLLILLPALALFLTACSSSGSIYTNYREVEQLQLIQTLGIDQAGEGLRLSISSGAGLDGTSPTLMSATAPSLIGAMERLQDYAPSEALFYAHTKYVLLGEDAAREGVAGYLDFLERDARLQLSIVLFVVRDGTAEELIASSGAGRTDITDLLASLERDILLRGESLPLSSREIARSLAETGAALVCAVEGAPTEGVLLSEGGELAALPAGYAVLKDGALRGWIPPETAPGVNLLLEQAGIGTVDLPTTDGGLVTLEFDNVSVKLTPRWNENGAPAGLAAHLTVSAALLELDEAAALAARTDEGLLDETLAARVSDLAREVLETSQRLGADFLDLAALFRRDDPEAFAAVADWPAALAELELEVTAEAALERTFDIGEPMDVEGGDDRASNG